MRGLFDATVAFSQGGESKRRSISGRAFRMVEVPVLSQRMRRGDVISRRDIEYIGMREADVASNVILDPARLVGLTPRRGVAATFRACPCLPSRSSSRPRTLACPSPHMQTLDIAVIPGDGIGRPLAAGPEPTSASSSRPSVT